jgi:hypothetical protein
MYLLLKYLLIQKQRGKRTNHNPQLFVHLHKIQTGKSVFKSGQEICGRTALGPIHSPTQLVLDILSPVVRSWETLMTSHF